MNVALIPKRYSILSRLPFFPKKMSALAMLWATLPTLLLLFNLGISWLKPTPFTQFLPFVALVGLVLPLRFKNVGLSISFSILALSVFLMVPHSEPNEKLWQMGIYFNMALTFYIALLAAEEIEECFAQMDAQETKTLHVQSQMQHDLLQIKHISEERQKELEDEIQRLKAEAEQRRIERCHEQSRFELIQSEIDLLNAQKNEFIEEARTSRASSIEAHHQLQSSQSQVSACEQKLKEMVQHIEVKTQEWIECAAANSYLTDQILASQNTIMTLQQRAPVEKIIKTQTGNEEIQKELNKSQGLYQQLRSQFQEKTEILAQTRRELFALQGRVESQEIEKKQATLSPNREEAQLFETHIHTLILEISVLEEEITHLECLISALFTCP